MSEPHLDHPGDVRWWKGQGPVAIAGPCPHAGCPHNSLGTIADGPDFDHYTLVACDVEDGCNGQCRAWTAEHPPAPQPPWYALDRPQFRLGAFLHAPTTERHRQ